MNYIVFLLGFLAFNVLGYFGKAFIDLEFVDLNILLWTEGERFGFLVFQLVCLCFTKLLIIGLQLYGVLEDKS